MNYISFKSQRYKNEIKITVVVLLTVNKKLCSLERKGDFFLLNNGIPYETSFSTILP